MRVRRERIREMWDSYRRDVMPAQAPPIQVDECRLAFYAGVLALKAVIFRDSSPGDDLNDQDEALVEDLLAELLEFDAEVRKRAGGRLDG